MWILQSTYLYVNCHGRSAKMLRQPRVSTPLVRHTMYCSKSTAPSFRNLHIENMCVASPVDLLHMEIHSKHHARFVVSRGSIQSIERCTDRTRSSHRARNRWVKAQSMPCRRCMVRQSLFLFLLLLVYTLAYINAKVTLDIRYPWTSPLFVSFFSILSHSTFLFVAKNAYDVFAFYALRRVIVTIREAFERSLQFSLKCHRSEPRVKRILQRF